MLFYVLRNLKDLWQRKANEIRLWKHAVVHGKTVQEHQEALPFQRNQNLGWFHLISFRFLIGCHILTGFKCHLSGINYMIIKKLPMKPKKSFQVTFKTTKIQCLCKFRYLRLFELYQIFIPINIKFVKVLRTDMPWATVKILNRYEYFIGSYWFDICQLHMFGLSVLDHAHESICLKPILRLYGFFEGRLDFLSP